MVKRTNGYCKRMFKQPSSDTGASFFDAQVGFDSDFKHSQSAFENVMGQCVPWPQREVDLEERRDGSGSRAKGVDGQPGIQHLPRLARGS